MNSWRVYFKNEWMKLIRQPQVVWILLIGGWTLVGWAWLLGQGSMAGKRSVSFDGYFLGFFLPIQLISLPIFSLVFFVILYSERQNQTVSWLYRLPIRADRWYVAKFLTAWLLCLLVLLISLLVAGFVLYGYATDVIDNLTMSQFFGKLMAISAHLMLLTVPMWLTFFLLSSLIRTPTIAVLVLLVLQILTGFSHHFPNPFAALRLAIGYASANGLISYQPELQAQYVTAGVYVLLVALAVWLYGRWRPNKLVNFLLN
ncbi:MULTISPECIES: ABC transporter permease [unclassified Spirosoma]|uniref:ABC transporter permease n=1 Tax=unclassified Spirosoma TaxID=2621999 RepID=UPI00095F895A|nr:MULTISPECIES: ABC transporter permease [unclassified Spirosoma]MBN8823132.1 ABC transporter permease [Spirosoma sp.]OJW73219.1 MAG: hypothetical protein BGO59_06975 [Spirosoma sp. 48-14]